MSSAKYNIAVIGPIPHDHITTHQGEVIEKYGCALHPAIGISRLLGDQGTVKVVSHVKQEDKEPVEEILAGYDNIEQQYIGSEKDQGDVIRLRFLDQNKRVEKQTGFMNPILPRDVEGVLDCEVFVCVPITDYELPLETLKYIKQNSDGIIIFDAHGPTNSVSVDGQRFLRYWFERDLWLPSIDVLKMNLEESHCVWYEWELDPEKKGQEDETRTALDDPRLKEFGEYVLDHGVKCLVVTLDSSGSYVMYKKDGQYHREIVPAIWVDNVVDTTGCGDSFAGGLGFGLLQNASDFITALHYANALGAQRTQGKTFDVFLSREETDAMIRKHYVPT